MTKKELEQYRSIVAELDEIRERLNEHTVCDTVTGSDSEFPYVKHYMSVRGIEETEQTKKDIKLYHELEKQKQNIDNFVRSIKNIELRQILMYKYIIGQYKMTWSAVTKKMYPRIDASYMLRMKESIRKKCERLLKKI